MHAGVALPTAALSAFVSRARAGEVATVWINTPKAHATRPHQMPATSGRLMNAAASRPTAMLSAMAMSAAKPAMASAPQRVRTAALIPSVSMTMIGTMSGAIGAQAGSAML
jgi:hypothetical protein